MLPRERGCENIYLYTLYILLLNFHTFLEHNSSRNAKKLFYTVGVHNLTLQYILLPQGSDLASENISITLFFFRLQVSIL